MFTLDLPPDAGEAGVSGVGSADAADGQRTNIAYEQRMIRDIGLIFRSYHVIPAGCTINRCGKEFP
jgi:hypothetical protein